MFSTEDCPVIRLQKPANTARPRASRSALRRRTPRSGEGGGDTTLASRHQPTARKGVSRRRPESLAHTERHRQQTMTVSSAMSLSADASCGGASLRSRPLASIARFPRGVWRRHFDCLPHCQSGPDRSRYDGAPRYHACGRVVLRYAPTSVYAHNVSVAVVKRCSGRVTGVLRRTCTSLQRPRWSVRSRSLKRSVARRIPLNRSSIPWADGSARAASSGYAENERDGVVPGARPP